MVLFAEILQSTRDEDIDISLSVPELSTELLSLFLSVDRWVDAEVVLFLFSVLLPSDDSILDRYRDADSLESVDEILECFFGLWVFLGLCAVLEREFLSVLIETGDCVCVFFIFLLFDGTDIRWHIRFLFDEFLLQVVHATHISMEDDFLTRETDGIGNTFFEPAQKFHRLIFHPCSEVIDCTTDHRRMRTDTGDETMERSICRLIQNNVTILFRSYFDETLDVFWEECFLELLVCSEGTECTTDQEEERDEFMLLC